MQERRIHMEDDQVRPPQRQSEGMREKAEGGPFPDAERDRASTEKRRLLGQLGEGLDERLADDGAVADRRD
jgi:hypothetical protein